ncbi:MAG: hypothetical protein H7144_01565 [Burkholderiales bacterium]|nr:hypothetical protein [Phycisphaerae bacterium]
MSTSTEQLDEQTATDHRLSAHSWRVLAILVLFALVVRIGLLLGLHQVTHGREFADDFNAYRTFLKHPLILFSADGLDDVPDAVIYSPLIPVQVWFPGKLLSDALGTFYGHRLSMILYDVTALSVTAWAMLRVNSRTWKKKEWIAALMLMCVPGSVGASALWGQEDCIAAMWTSFAMIALLRGHPTIAALFGGIGLFTHKLFALLLSLGIFLTSRASRAKILVTTGAITIIFFIFLFVRWKLTGMFLDRYAYNAISNSPSPWGLLDRMMGVDKLSFETLRPIITVTTAIALVLISLATLYFRGGRSSPEASVVATHTTFFVVFVGIQPEHHQWFMPFLILFAWRRFLAGDWLTFALAWSFSGLAYGFKISYGLQARQSIASAGKDVFREWLGASAGETLWGLQLAFHLLTMLVGILLVYRAVTADETRELSLEPLG